MKATLFGGAVWNACPLTEIADLCAVDADELVSAIADELSWLPYDKALALAERLLRGEGPILAGYAGTMTGLVAEPDDEWDIIGVSRYGDAVLLAPGDCDDSVYPYIGEVFEPYYVDLFVDSVE